MKASIMGLSRSDETVGIEELSWLLNDMEVPGSDGQHNSQVEDTGYVRKLVKH